MRKQPLSMYVQTKNDAASDRIVLLETVILLSGIGFHLNE